jgi:hypothetical protein
MSFNEYSDSAKKMVAYFSKNLAESGDYWKYGYEISMDWLDLTGEEDVSDSTLGRLKERLENPPEEQGSAYYEMKILISKWIETLQR